MSATVLAAAKWLGHLLVLLVVLCLPPVLYDYATGSSLRQVHILHGSGALAYTAYALYWVNRLSNDRARFILSSLVLLLTLGFFVIWTSDRSTKAWVSALPLAFALCTLALAFGAAVLKRWRLMGSALWTAALTLPLGVIFSLMSAMAGMPVSLL